MSIFYVYAHYIEDTGELFYIGKGKSNRHADKRGRNKIWHNIVKKHGFVSQILIGDLEEPDSYIQEILAIKEFNPRANISKGGTGGYNGPNSGNFAKGRVPWNKDKKCRNISERQLGSKNHMFGKRNKSCFKKIKCVTDGKIFESIKDCYQYYNISESGLFNSLRKNTPIKGRNFQRV